ncbi:hypothetical protein ACWGIP_16565, partial [Streptomyces sp. NPDC054838]
MTVEGVRRLPLALPRTEEHLGGAGRAGHRRLAAVRAGAGRPGTPGGRGGRCARAARLRAATEVSGAFPGVHRSRLALRADTAPGLDPAVPEHREAPHRWLNSRGCRLRHPRAAEPDRRWRAGHRLPGERPAALTDAQIGVPAAAYGEPAALPRGRRMLGPTAAAKALFALLPDTVVPWDAAIAAAGTAAPTRGRSPATWRR